MSRNKFGPNAYIDKHSKGIGTQTSNKKSADSSITLSRSNGSVDSPSPSLNAKRLLARKRHTSRLSPLKRDLKRTVSTINNQFNKLKSIVDHKPVISLRKVEEPDEYHNTSHIKIK